MKKMTLLAAMAVCGAGAMNAQLVDPSLDQTIDNGQIFDIFMLDNASVTRLEEAGKTVHLYNVDETTRHMYIWTQGGDENITFVAGNPSNGVGVDFQTDGFTCLEVSTYGWSGAGLTIDEGAPIDLSHISDDTHFHMGVRPENNAPAAIAVIIGDGTNVQYNMKWSPAKISVGSSAFIDGGVSYPLVGDFDREGGDWLAIDLTFGDLKKLYPSFAYLPGEFFGNIFSVLGGGVQGQSFSMDACYLYSPANGGVEGVAADEAQIVVSAKTVSVLGGEEGIDIYNVSGQLVKSTESTIVGVEDLTPGIYVVKAGNAVKKVVIR
ncbi:MAG TPA: T9SS type A sorting domain-containing protein [Candidatus Limisoma gallistercoris]|nr:T9SS type A sorting domain-containing protein [Candidatus Limisoma gallistercoris]